MIRYTPGAQADDSPLARYVQQELTKIADTIASNQYDEPVRVPTYLLANIPAAAAYPDSLIKISDEVGGDTLCFSDGTNWRRVQDRAIVA